MIGLPPVATCLAITFHRVVNRPIIADVLTDIEELKAGRRTCVEANFLFTTACLAAALSIPIATVIALTVNSLVGGPLGVALGYFVLLSSFAEVILSYILMRYYGATDEIFLPSAGLAAFEALLLCIVLGVSIALSCGPG